MTAYREPERVPRCRVRLALEAVLGVGAELVRRADAYAAAWLDARPLRAHLARLSSWVRGAYSRARARARRRAFGPAGGVVVAVPAPPPVMTTAVDVTPPREEEREIHE